MPRPEALIHGVLYSNQEHLLFGPQGTFKTFLVLDWMLCIVTGKKWHSRVAKQAPVLYICGEGGGRVFADRIMAWCQKHGEPTPQAELFAITETPLMMDDPEVLETIKARALIMGAKLIVIDTLLANFSGDENAAEDMSAFSKAVRVLRMATGAAVLVVHHTGHVATDRPQGSNAIRRNIDIELRLEKDGNDSMLARVVGGGELKSKNTPPLGHEAFRASVIELDGQRDPDGVQVTTLVLDPSEDEVSAAKNKKDTMEELLYRALVREIGDDTSKVLTRDEIVKLAKSSNSWRGLGSFRSLLRRMVEKGYLIEAVGGHKVVTM